jgi:hypothetical protein
MVSWNTLQTSKPLLLLFINHPGLLVSSGRFAPVKKLCLVHLDIHSLHMPIIWGEGCSRCEHLQDLPYPIIGLGQLLVRAAEWAFHSRRCHDVAAAHNWPIQKPERCRGRASMQFNLNTWVEVFFY